MIFLHVAHTYRKTLGKVRCFLRIAGDGSHAASQLHQELTTCACGWRGPAIRSRPQSVQTRGQQG